MGKGSQTGRKSGAGVVRRRLLSTLGVLDSPGVRDAGVGSAGLCVTSTAPRVPRVSVSRVLDTVNPRVRGELRSRGFQTSLSVS